MRVAFTTATNEIGVVWKGLTGSDPVAIANWSAPSDTRTATFSGTVTGGTGSPTANTRVKVMFASPEAQLSGTSSSTPFTFSMMLNQAFRRMGVKDVLIPGGGYGRNAKSVPRARD